MSLLMFVYIINLYYLEETRAKFAERSPCDLLGLSLSMLLTVPGKYSALIWNFLWLIILHFKTWVSIFSFLYLPKICSSNDFYNPLPSKFNNIVINLILWALIFSRTFTTPNPSNSLGSWSCSLHIRCFFIRPNKILYHSVNLFSIFLR